MKLFSTIAAGVMAMMVTATAQQDPVLSPGILIKKDGKHEKVFLAGANKNNVYYKVTKRAVNIDSIKRTELASVYTMQPKDFRDAKQLFEGRKYAEALTAFSAVREKYKKMQALPDNYSTQAWFYELECYRKQLDIGQLAEAAEAFRSENLMRENQLQQIEILVFWKAVHNKEWSRIDRLAKEWKRRKVPCTHRAQIAYCHGLALEALKRDSGALNAYATAMTADFSKSEEIVRESALNSLRIFSNDEEIKVAMRLWKTEDEKPASDGYLKLLQANALARLYVKAGLGSGVSLPANYKKFLEYNAEEEEQEDDDSEE